MTDEAYIELTLQIAKKGSGFVSPNPLVGAVIVKDHRIISAGYHEKYGGNHAEVNAINNSSESVEGATLYVNLEPCSHFGKTPPCVDAIINSKIKRVVIGTLDVNPLVSGKGVQKLIEHGIDVKIGVKEKECAELNRFFFKNINSGLPFITLKSAQTLDGKIADSKGNSKWISSEESRKYVHYLRSKYDAVLVGANTVNKDNPMLNVRLTEGRNPTRIILDGNLTSKLNSFVFDTTHQSTILIASNKSELKSRKINLLQRKGVRIIFVKSNNKGKINLTSALKDLSKLGINSILVEGGSRVFSSFINENLFDEVKLFVCPKFLGDGLDMLNFQKFVPITKAKKIRINSFSKIGDDLLIDLRN
ncbi:MAG: bifunctional diaminohydroxyphosphoribosylaminopyrimidine deaminase/5-amino-6-(5-phosphoribosylamino)uracil reductase RibD [Ignavibacteriaceae bacterium]|nr:bifunctional diaminohydroxyphosphoribosylaminopyrimidine deaminase/5-amino-6-(5-phosphoribosylamino)uracil reductase RibD [Ignavibacteriaceae bacterium]